MAASRRPADAEPAEAPAASVAAPELYRCPVRRRYLWQLLRYRRPNERWRRRLHAGAAGAGATAAELGELLRLAQEGTSHYPRAFAAAGVHWRDLRSPADLACFPDLSRRTLQEAHLELFSRRVGRAEIGEGWLGTTSGSTGEPVQFFMDGESIHFFTAFVRFLWERHRLGAPPRPGSSGIVLLCTLPRSAIYETWLPLFGWTRFRKLHWDEPEALAELRRLAPAVVTGDPASLERLAQAIEAGRLELRPRLVLSSAFALDERLAARLRLATGAAVVDYYSLAETGPLAWRCSESPDRLHVLEGAVELEQDRGEVLVTNLRNRLFPLVRYRTGDLAALEAPGAACACGFAGRSLVQFEGRVASRFIDAAGRRVDPSQLQPLLSRLEVRQFQLHQLEPAAVRLRYCAGRELAPGATDELERALSRLLGGATVLSLERSASPLFEAGEKPIVYRGPAA